MGPVLEMPPRGYYTAREVAALAGVSPGAIGQWARAGYIRSSQADGPPRIYAFQDVAEAMVVHELRERKATWKQIRLAIASLREDYGSNWPLTAAGPALSTATGPGAKRTRVVVQRGDSNYDVGDRPWHQLLSVEKLRKLIEDLQRGGWVVRDLPDLEYVEVDPDRLSGRPTIRGRRVAAADVARLAEAPGGVEVLHDGYDLTDDEISDARRWWQATSALIAA